MRSLLLATLAVIAIPACTNDITGGSGGGGGGGGGGDDGSGTGDTCSCPDGSTLPAGECATECPAPSSGAGAIAVATDMATYPGQLSTSVAANVTVTGSQGFSGLVTLAATITAGAGGAAITEWPVTLDNTMVSVTMNGTATAKATIMIPSTAIPSTDTKTLSGTLNITATPMATTVTAASTTAALAITNALEIDMSATTSACTFPAATIAGIQVAVGTTVNWKNVGTANDLTIHVDNSPTGTGIDHQGETGSLPTLGGNQITTPPGDTWPEVVTAIGPGKVTWHCHAPNDAPSPGPSFTIVQPE
jgi:hypothetical protein